MRVEDVIGARIASVREANGTTQEQLAVQVSELLGKSWTRQAVWAAEKGRRAFSAVELVAIAVALGVSVDRLLTPPRGVVTVELPGGRELDRTELNQAVVPGRSVAQIFEEMSEALVSLGRAAAGRLKYEQAEAAAVETLFTQIASASKTFAHREEMQRERHEDGQQ